jgi:hypothetical protein
MRFWSNHIDFIDKQLKKIIEKEKKEKKNGEKYEHVKHLHYNPYFN